jgi:hypothetical protein
MLNEFEVNGSISLTGAYLKIPLIILCGNMRDTHKIIKFGSSHKRKREKQEGSELDIGQIVCQADLSFAIISRR